MKGKQNRMSEPITISQATGSKIAGKGTAHQLLYILYLHVPKTLITKPFINKLSLCLLGNVDEMDEMFNSLKKGGVTLTGQNQPTTHDQLRKSFIKRNKNPVINEKIHTLRALQSTLKVRHSF